jgi:hypothetical protein
MKTINKILPTVHMILPTRLAIWWGKKLMKECPLSIPKKRLPKAKLPI